MTIAQDMNESVRVDVALDRSLLEKVLALTGPKTKRAVIEEALQALIRLKRRERLSALQDKLFWESREPGSYQPQR